MKIRVSRNRAVENRKKDFTFEDVRPRGKDAIRIE